MKTALAWLLLPFALISNVLHAQQLSSAGRTAQVEVRAWLGNVDNENKTPQFMVNQQIVLSIDVGTPRWFTSGTKIQNVELPNVIAMQRNSAAMNYTERRGGQTWSHQRWELTLYPQSSGQYVIEPLDLSITVSADDGKPLSGIVRTPVLNFQVVLPSGLIDTQNTWFSASEVEVLQQWQLSNEELQAGDSISRTVTVKAKDSLSVLLPTLLSAQHSDFYQAYLQPSALQDTQTRGNYNSQRKEELVYVLQQGGALTIPELEFQWWNSDAQQLETVIIEGREFVIKHTFQSWVKSHSIWVASFAAFVFIFAMSAWLWRKYYRSHPTPVWLNFHRLLKRSQWGKLRTLIYREHRVRRGLRTLLPDKSLSSSWQSDSVALQEGSEDRQVYKRLWRLVRRKPSHSHSGWRDLLLPKALPELARLKKTPDKHQS